ncbi:MAG: TolC family protein, partial [Paludibacteraceae bacterium]|nr:TolC family protein [Paludibacteraceae bacterium]
VEAAELQAEIAERDGLEQVEEVYWLVYGIDQKQAIIDDATALLDTLYRQVSVAVEAGLAMPSDLMQVEMKRDEVARRQIQLNSGRALARRALAVAIGLPDADSLVLCDMPEDVDTLVMHDSAVVTVERQLLDLQVRATVQQRRMALADALPQIALGANYGYGHFQTNMLRDGLRSKNGNGALFVTMRLPLTGWWETAHKLKQYNYALRQAELDIDNLGTQLDMRTQQAYDQWVEAVAILRLQQRTALHAEEAYRQTRANFEAGMATMTELLQAQTTMNQAQSDLTDAQISVRLTQRRYTDLISRQ